MTPCGSLLCHSFTWHSYNTAALQRSASELHAQKVSMQGGKQAAEGPDLTLCHRGYAGQS